jgi:hypothetical protein
MIIYAFLLSVPLREGSNTITPPEGASAHCQIKWDFSPFGAFLLMASRILQFGEHPLHCDACSHQIIDVRVVASDEVFRILSEAVTRIIEVEVLSSFIFLDGQFKLYKT